MNVFSPVINMNHLKIQTIRMKKCCSFINAKPNTMGVLKQVAEYLYLKKKDPNEDNSGWIKYMHGINRISIFMFLFALIVIIIRLFIKRH